MRINGITKTNNIMLRNYYNKKETIIEDFASWEGAFKEVSKEIHWKEGRSAYSLACYFCKSNGESNLKQILGLGNYNLERAEIEYESKFDTFRGRGRMQDLHMIFKNSSENVIVEVEAKVDEFFGDRIEEAYAKALQIKKEKPTSQKIERISNLIQTIFGEGTTLEEVKDYRYQLLYYLAGSLEEAKRNNAKKLIMPVLVFETNSYDKTLASWNKKDYEAFIEKVGFEERKIDGIISYAKTIDGIEVRTLYLEIKIDQ